MRVGDSINWIKWLGFPTSLHSRPFEMSSRILNAADLLFWRWTEMDGDASLNRGRCQ